MQQIREKSIENRLRETVKRLGGWAVKFWPLTVTGFPDRIILMPGGRIWFVELKRPGKTVKKEGTQSLIHKRLIALGFKVRVIADYETLEQFIYEVQAA